MSKYVDVAIFHHWTNLESKSFDSWLIKYLKIGYSILKNNFRVHL